MPANQDSEPIQILNSALPISVPVYVPTSLKIWRYSLLIFGLALNIFLGILLWVYLTFPLFYFSLQQISYATLSESARMVITGVMVPNISYMLGILSGSWNFMRMRKQPNKNIAIAAEDVHVTISNTMDKTTRFLTRLFITYIFAAITFIVCWTWVASHDHHGFADIILPFAVQVLIFIFLIVPGAVFSLLRLFVLKKRPDPPFEIPFTRLEQSSIYVLMFLVVVWFGVNILFAASTLFQIVTHPAPPVPPSVTHSSIQAAPGSTLYIQ
jgi:hypothetical protein